MSTSDRHGDEAITEPAKLLRVATMVREVLEELHHDGFSEAARARVDTLQRTAIDELGDTMSADLRAELDRLVHPPSSHGEHAPSQAELRVSEAQLSGWLEGLFQGMQASAMAEQAARAQSLQLHDQEQEQGADRHRSSYL